MPDIHKLLIDDLTTNDILYVLFALDAKIRFFNGQNKSLMKRLCPHSHEKEFLNKNDSKLLNCIIWEKDFGVLNIFYQRMSFIAEMEPSVEDLKLEFCKVTENKHYTEVLLFCANLLIDFHLDDNCSEHLSLALKYYLKAYEIINFSYHEESANIIKDMLQYLKVISLYKCKHEIFSGYIKEFLWYYGVVGGPFNTGEDVFYPILSEIFELSHKIQFDFLAFLNNGSFIWKKYTQRSMLVNFGGYMILANHGHEDQNYEGSIKEYKEAIIRADLNNMFGGQDINVKEFNNVMYRSVQVLYAYIKYIYHTEYDDAKKVEEALRCVWNSVPDSFLTKNKFLFCFKELHADVLPELHKAWEWYEKNVLIDHEPENSPRSLRHISRCAIRRRLTSCALLPDCVKSLEIPITLKSYLCLM